MKRQVSNPARAIEIGDRVYLRHPTKKLGMRYEGIAKRYLRIAGTWEDHEHWAITAEEWQRKNAG
jgi:hypothetical protein